MLRKKLTELQNKIPDISTLATKTALTAVENKVPSVSSLVKKTDYDTKITDLIMDHDKHIATLAANVFNATLAQANLKTKIDFDAKLSSLIKALLQINQRIYLLKTN